MPGDGELGILDALAPWISQAHHKFRRPPNLVVAGLFFPSMKPLMLTCSPFGQLMNSKDCAR